MTPTLLPLPAHLTAAGLHGTAHEREMYREILARDAVIAYYRTRSSEKGIPAGARPAGDESTPQTPRPVRLPDESFALARRRAGVGAHFRGAQLATYTVRRAVACD
ncbi:hypothetical protein ACIGZH_01910 [Streptomyces sp. NPDC058319]|uniref:hypothetical protein n=1 Tax=unclassified Streptomyces TaxID=2593676 RepID=UPI0036F079A2